MIHQQNLSWHKTTSPLWFTAMMVATGLLVAPAMARDRDHDSKRHRGYVDGSAFAKLANEDGTLVEISIHGALLKTVATALAKENEALADFLEGIVSINAVVLENSDNQEEAQEVAADMTERLTKDGWERIARIRDGDDHVTVLVLPDDKNEDSLAGITVMVSEGGGDVVFANIAGRIDLSIIGPLSKGLNLPGLDQLSDLDFGDAVKKSKNKKHSRE